MTVPSSVAKSGPYLCNGVTDVFNYDFRIVDKTHIRVILTDTHGQESDLTLTTHYTVSDVGSDTGSINLTSAGVALATTGKKLTNVRNPPFTQETDLQNQGAYLAQTVEDRFDLLTMQIQTVKERSDRSIAVLASDNTTTLDDLTADLITVAGIADDVSTVAANDTNVSTVAGISTDVTTVAGVATDIPTVAGVASDIPTVAAIASSIPTVADNVADITNFSDVYLGPKATAPTTRNDGSALQAGDLYFDTTTNGQKSYTGSIWIGAGVGDMLAANDLSDVSDKNAALINIGAAPMFGTTTLSAAYDPATAPDYFQTAGYDAIGDGGGGLYEIVDTDPAEPGSFALPNISKWAKLTEDGVTFRHFGAHPSRGDNSAYLQDGCDYADEKTVPVRLPAGTYGYGTGLTRKQNTGIQGDGKIVSRLLYGGTGDALTFHPDPTLTDTRAFWKLADFSIIPDTAGQGCGLRLLLDGAGQFISNFEIDNIFIGPFAADLSKGALNLDNSAGNGDGIFKGVVRGSWFESGIRVRNGGDSLSFVENVIHGNGIGVYATLVDGARQFVLRNNSITHLGIGAYLSGVVAAHIFENWFETPLYLGANQADPGSGLIYLENSPDTTVVRNTLQTLNGYDNPDLGVLDGLDYHVAVVGTSDRVLVSRNEHGSYKTADVQVFAKNTRIDPDYRIIGTQRDLVVADSGFGTMGISKPAVLTNGWGTGSYGEFDYYKDLEGWVHLSGSVSAGTGTIATLPVGFRPATNLRFLCPQDTNITTLQVASTGAIDEVSAAAQTNLSLDGIKFRAANAT